MPFTSEWSTPEWYWIDPRPDLIEDADLWQYLLPRIANPNDYDRWHAYRCAGFQLLKVQDQLRLCPVIDAIRGFETNEEYFEFKQIYMIPYKEQIHATLKTLQKRWEERMKTHAISK